MALPIPDKMSRDRFRNDAEFAVYSALHEQLTDDWVLVPSMELRLDSLPGERELDLLLVHPHYGLLIVEVKSFAFYVHGGQFFYFDGTPVKKISSFTTFDLSGRWAVTDEFELSASVENVFDRIAPLDPLTYGGVNYNPMHFSGAIGRYFTVGAKYTFK